MSSENRLLGDAAKLASGALGTLAGMRRELETLARQQLERLLARMDLVSRDEFEAVKAMAAKARTENESLAARIDALESKKGGAESKKGGAESKKGGAAKSDSAKSAKPRSRAKPAAKKER